MNAKPEPPVTVRPWFIAANATTEPMCSKACPGEMLERTGGVHELGCDQALTLQEGEVLVSIDGEPPFFPARVDSEERWNGWLIPSFRREAAEAVVRWTNALHAEYPENQRAEWDGDAVLLYGEEEDHPVAPEPPERIAPEVAEGEEPRWSIGAWNWTWTHVNPARLVADIPPSAVVGYQAWEIRTLGAWLELAGRAGVEPDASTHEVSTVECTYDEERVAGAVRIGWHWWLIVRDGEQARAEHLRRAFPDEMAAADEHAYTHVAPRWHVEADPNGVAIALTGDSDEVYSPAEARKLSEAIREAADAQEAAFPKR